MIVLQVIFIFLLLSYSTIIIYFLFKWNDIPFFKANCTKYFTTLSIIVAFRNEEKNISILLDHLLVQDYPAMLFEIILVDDFSDDNSIDLINSRLEEANRAGISLKIITAKFENKKNAIQEGIKSSAAELIVTTDADCRMSKNWLRSLVCYYQYFNFDAASAPVILQTNSSLWNKFMRLEFLSLISTGAASVEAGIPVMCNGANLIYKKSAFEKVHGFEAIDETPSGDDVLLFQKMAAKKNKLNFIKSEEAIVVTETPVSLQQFFNQRKRWSSKVTTNFYAPSFIIAIIVYLFSLSILLTGILSFQYEQFFKAFIFMFSIKIFVDLIFFHSVLNFFKEKSLLFLLLPAEMFYIVYVSAVGSLAPFTGYKWKGRSHK